MAHASARLFHTIFCAFYSFPVYRARSMRARYSCAHHSDISPLLYYVASGIECRARYLPIYMGSTPTRRPTRSTLGASLEPFEDETGSLVVNASTLMANIWWSVISDEHNVAKHSFSDDRAQ